MSSTVNQTRARSHLLADFEARMLAEKFKDGRLTKGNDAEEIRLDGYVIVNPHQLGAPWSVARKPFHSATEAEVFLAAHGFVANPVVESASAVATQLALGQLYCLPVYPGSFANPGVGRATTLVVASDLVVNTVNNARPYPTRIDFKWISENEGGQWRRGYIPFSTHAKAVIGKSGMTIGSGFDIGQFSKGQFKQYPRIETLFTPWYAFQMKHSNAQTIQTAMLTRGPVPVLEKNEAEIVDQVSFTQKKQYVIDHWDNVHAQATPRTATPQPGGHTLPDNIAPRKPLKRFGALSRNWQSVLVDYVYQVGHLYGYFKRDRRDPKITHWVGSKFGDLAISGDAEGAKKILRSLGADDARSWARYEKIKDDMTGLLQDAPATPQSTTPNPTP